MINAQKPVNRFTRTLSAVAVTAACLSSQTVFAQQNNDESRGKLERIEVTARKTVESLQETPVAITSIGATELTEKGISVLTEIQQFSPNTTMQTSRGTNSTLTAFIRGLGQQDPLWGYEPGVGIYIDDVYMARPQGAVLDLLDVQRIEVLRGPQGTLYGKNTIGGAMKYVTRDLTGYNEFEVKGTIGTYNQTDLKVACQTALSNNFYIGGASGFSGILYLQNEKGGFSVSSNQPWTKDKDYEECLTCQ